ncbi:MAG TPA: aminobenzoate oxygenase, partial [Actinomycetota bacterium]|nr:aminobenzoate oxygenase [Actinomycetota bacterium]
MRDRFTAHEVWEHLGFPVEECLDFVRKSEMMQSFRKMLFSRIVPTVKDLGLFGPKVQKAFQDMGVIEFVNVNPDDLSAADEEIARDLDRRKGKLTEEEAATAALAGIDPARAEEVKATIESGASS